MKEEDRLQLSKEISYALRHVPWEYGLEVDEEGWVEVGQLLSSLRENEHWKDIQEKDVHEMIRLSEKKRHEIKNGKIRAFYGHTIPMRIRKDEERPPQYLYHGTTRKALQSIWVKGIIPCARQYVHLSKDIEIAKDVGKRRTDSPVLLKVEAEKAFKDGIPFYRGNENVWLADWIPPGYIKECE